MEFAPCEVDQLVEDIWASLGLAVRRSGAAAYPAGPGDLTGCVQITGAWEGAVLVVCPRPLAAALAAAMFALPPGGAGDADAVDALAELTNITGGNLKGMIDGHCLLSLPTVTHGRSYSVQVVDSLVALEAVYEHGGTPFAVSVLRAADRAGRPRVRAARAEPA